VQSDNSQPHMLIGHAVDETKEPRRRAPKSMIISVIMNAIMQFAFGICVLFCLGDYDTVAASKLPLVEIYYGASVAAIPIHGLCSVANIMCTEPSPRPAQRFWSSCMAPFSRSRSSISSPQCLDWYGPLHGIRVFLSPISSHTYGSRRNTLSHSKRFA
jgi:hypothetical protein